MVSVKLVRSPLRTRCAPSSILGCERTMLCDAIHQACPAVPGRKRVPESPVRNCRRRSRERFSSCCRPRHDCPRGLTTGPGNRHDAIRGQCSQPRVSLLPRRREVPRGRVEERRRPHHDSREYRSLQRCQVLRDDTGQLHSVAFLRGSKGTDDSYDREPGCCHVWVDFLGTPQLDLGNGLQYRCMA